jgi:hypothetical protein
MTQEVAWCLGYIVVRLHNTEMGISPGPCPQRALGISRPRDAFPKLVRAALIPMSCDGRQAGPSLSKGSGPTPTKVFALATPKAPRINARCNIIILIGAGRWQLQYYAYWNCLLSLVTLCQPPRQGVNTKHTVRAGRQAWPWRETSPQPVTEWMQSFSQVIPVTETRSSGQYITPSIPGTMNQTRSGFSEGQEKDIRNLRQPKRPCC